MSKEVKNKSRNVLAYDLLISCPSDVSSSLPSIMRAIDNFNLLYGRQHDIVIRPVHWSKNSFSQSGGSPQELLNKQIVDESDMVVGIFWTKFGTPTNKYNSGTEEEIEKMIASNKQVFLYFLQSPVSLGEVDFKQYERIVEFKNRYKDQGIYFDIKDNGDLANTFYKDLYLYVDSLRRAPAFKETTSDLEVLWVDDYPENNWYERKTLEQYGIVFTLAKNTQQALDLMKKHRFSLIISDMGRQESSTAGYVLLREVRKINKTIPYIIYAGSKSAAHLQETIKRGGQGNTNDPAELIDMVISFLS